MPRHLLAHRHLDSPARPRTLTARTYSAVAPTISAITAGSSEKPTPQIVTVAGRRPDGPYAAAGSLSGFSSAVSPIEVPGAWDTTSDSSCWRWRYSVRCMREITRRCTCAVPSNSW